MRLGIPENKLWVFEKWRNTRITYFSALRITVPKRILSGGNGMYQKIS